MNNFHAEISRLCESQKMKECNLADQLHVAKSTLSKYLDGKRVIPLSIFMHLCSIFSVTAEQMYAIYVDSM